MKKYKVLKSFPSSDAGYHHLVGEIYKPTQSHTRTQNLLDLGYIEELSESLMTVWDLEKGDNCYYITQYGGLGGSCGMGDEQLGYMRQAREIGNCFLSLKKAERAVEWLKARAILLRDTKGYRPDWGEQPDYKFGVCYDAGAGSLTVVGYRNSCPHKEPWFRSEKEALASIKHHELEWYAYLGLKDKYNETLASRYRKTEKKTEKND